MWNKIYFNFWFWSFVTFLCCIAVKAAKFYPYGLQNNDKALEKQDDAFTTVNINIDFHFFGLPFSRIHVSTNGIIYFGVGSTSFTPVPFPINGTLSVAAYWVDSDPREGGDIFYREEFDPVILNNITKFIRSKFVQFNSFTSTWSMIVTFSNVSRFGCRGSAVFPCHNVVNHQTILTSNGIHSFVIFLYDRLEYANAQIGFNAGDGKRFFLVPYSNTENISRYALENSNVGLPSEWMFSIGDEIAAVCNALGLLEVFPKKVLYFGPQVLLLSGPCFEKNVTDINVKIGKFSKTCPVSGYKIKCTTSYMDNSSRVPISLIYNNVEFKSFFIPIDVEDLLIKNSTFFNLFNPEEKYVDLNWNQLELDSDWVEVRGTIEDISYDFSGKIIKIENRYITLNVSNTGKYRYDFADPLSKSKATRVLINVKNVVYEIFRHSNDVTCKDWYKNEPSTDEINKIADEESKRNPCQPLIPSNFPDQLPGGFKRDASCNPENPGACDKFHKGAKGCYRSSNNPNGYAVQCCYNKDGQLIVGPQGGGSLDMADSDASKLNHFWKDIRPYLYCCKMSDECDKYYIKRPSIDSRNYVPPRPVRASGDPHFVTLDGTSYDFNPIGEFVYLKTPDTIVQTRIKQYMNGNNLASASYFAAFAIQVQDNVTFQIELSSNDRLQLRIENQIWAEESLDLGSVVVDLKNSSNYNVETTTGLSMNFMGSGGMLHVIISLKPFLKRQVKGLIGNWDDDQSNDLMLPNGTWIPIPSPPQDIHNKFGMSWTTTNETSIFSYPEGLNWKDFQNHNFVPFFGEPPEDIRCDGNKQCMFDVHVTGDINAGLSNTIIQNEFEKIVERNDQMDKTCDVILTIPNGNITIFKLNNRDASHVNYTITCKEHYKLKGNAFGRCVDGVLLEAYGICSFSVSMIFQLKFTLPLIFSSMFMIYM